MCIGVRGSLVALAAIMAARPASVAQEPDSAPQAQVLLRRDIAAAIPQLQRTIALQLEGASLDEALQTVAHRAELPITYNDAILPRDRKVWLTATEIRTDEALEEILRDSGLQLLPLASGQVVVVKARTQGRTVTGHVTDAKSGKPIPGASVSLEGTRWRVSTAEDGAYRMAEVAPGSYTLTAGRIGYTKQSQAVTVAAERELTVDVRLELSASPLDAVVVTGTLVPTEVKALPTPISVVTAGDIQQQNLQRVDQLFRGQVPGAIAWDQGPINDYSTINVRGASSLLYTPGIKTFIDGVEVADQQYIATLDPNSIDRIEITRGPQASTLYGAGALDGVMQIFTKKGQTGLARPEITAKLLAAGVGGFDGQSAALQTDNTVTVLGGEEKTSYSLGGSYRHTGAWVPSYQATDWGLSAGGQTSQGPLTLSGSARYGNKTFDWPWDTRFAAYTPFSQPPYTTERLHQQTYGVTGSLRATPSWQHTLTLGYDQTYVVDVQTQPSFTTPADSFMYFLGFHEARTSVFYHTDLSLRLGPTGGGVVAAGVNYTAYDQLYSYTYNATRTTGSLNGTTSLLSTPWTSTGYFGQLQISLADRFFFTGGLRAERNENFGANFGTAWSPRVGAAYVLEFGQATLKLRVSYGESIRAPLPNEREAQKYPFGTYLANPALAPERQKGADGGIELYLGRALLNMTYYNQRAVGLIQRVTIPDSTPTFQYQNINRVKNDGWEFEGRLPIDRIQLSATYSIARSTVQALPPNYPAGGYQVGDPVLGVPHSSAGASVSYSPWPQTTLTVSMTHIGHWTQTDWVALYGFYYGGQPYRGSSRAYWTEYPTVTKFAVGASQVLTTGLTAFVRCENVGNNLRAENANYFIPTPRRLTIGANVRY